MSTKTFNTRFQLKYDTWANWSNENNQFRLLEGEIAIVYVPESTGADGVLHEPAILFKVGDGVNTFNKLPFASALAGDVPTWAKATHIGEGDTKTKISDDAFVKALEDIEELKAYFSTDGEGGSAFNIAEALSVINGRLGGHDDAISTINASLSTLSPEVETIKSDYLKKADKEELVAAHNDHETRITEIENNYVTTDVFSEAMGAETARATVAEENLQNQINLIMNNPDTSNVVDSITEFTEYIRTHGTIAEGFRTDIDKNKQDIADLKDYVDSSAEETEDKVYGIVQEMTGSLKPVAFSGQIEDLTQKEEYVIFNCGSATTLISDPVVTEEN